MPQQLEESTYKEIVPSVERAARTLSVASVETDFVAGVYEKIGSVYDVLFGLPLHKGRVESIEHLNLSAEERILEVGVGTGINVSLYPSDCSVTAIDLSRAMLEKAERRIKKCGLTNIQLLQMDAEALTFPDNTFDVVYAPYTLSVVSDPVQVAREMRRVCRPGGRFVFLNHFLSSNRIGARLERFISPVTVHLGFKADLDLLVFLNEAGLKPVSVEKVNIPRLWSLVTCFKDD